MNEKVWLELKFDFVKWKRTVHQKEVTCKSVLIYLLRQISELANVRTGSDNFSDVTVKIISKVREVKGFSHVRTLYFRSCSW